MHHIIIRGIERKPIFKDKIDYGSFIDLFGYSGAEVARVLSLTPSAVSKSVVKGREDELARVIGNDLMTLLERQTVLSQKKCIIHLFKSVPSFF